jgi:hypothetical protein
MLADIRTEGVDLRIRVMGRDGRKGTRWVGGACLRYVIVTAQAQALAGPHS